MSKDNQFGLPEKILNQIIACLSQHSEIHWVKIYGSRAIGNYKTGSDIDLAISSDVKIPPGLSFELDDLSTPYLFDVTHYESLKNENLKSHIDRVGKIIYMSSK